MRARAGWQYRRAVQPLGKCHGSCQFRDRHALPGQHPRSQFPGVSRRFPGLRVPLNDNRIFELGPEFIVTGEVDADFALSNFDASVSIAYNFSEVATTFPQSGSTSGSFIKGTSGTFLPIVFALPLPPVSCAHIYATGVTVSASPDITDSGASVSVTGHLVPQIDISLSAFGGIVSSSVFLNLDASMDLSVTADSSDAQACVDASAELAVNVGAEAAFFNVFNASTNDTLFDKNFPLLQVCQHCFLSSHPRG